MRSADVVVEIDLERVRAAAEAIRAQTRVPLKAVVKADAYGLGARRVADVLASVADEFCYFTLAEAQDVGRPGLVLGPPSGAPAVYAALRVRPSIGNAAQAERYGRVRCAINLDTGMQRFGCAASELAALVRTCNVEDVWCHANHVAAAEQLRAAIADLNLPRHAAASALLDAPETWLDGVRPGVALYRAALCVTAPLQVARETHGPVGYTGFTCPHVGVIFVGYSHGLRPAPVVINGRRQQMLEVGMNTTFVSLDPADRVGETVVLLGPALAPAEIATATASREHEVICRYAALGERKYR